MAENTKSNVNMGKYAKAVDLQELDNPDLGTASFEGDTSRVVVEGSDLDLEITADVINLKERTALLAFMEEPMTIMLAESTDANADAFVFCAVNGEPADTRNKTPWLRRGVEITTKRKFVERLLRAKPVAIKSVEVVGGDGARSIEYKRSSALRYPFQVIEDQNPRGRDWLRKVMLEG